MSAPPPSRGRLIAFRFGALVAMIYLFPFPLNLIPKTDWLSGPLNKPLEWLTSLVGHVAFGLGDPPGPTGSSDTTYAYVKVLTIVLLAALGAGVWSVIDRRRVSYPRLAAWLVIALRYFLAYMMIDYGFAKITKSQFPDLTPLRLSQPVGDMSPMGLLWTFMGYSTAYTGFAGALEAVGGVLLLWRRTATLGALLVCVVMSNVVMLNLCYDVAAKLLAAKLLIIALVLALSRMRRLIAAAMGHATDEEPPRTRLSGRGERARLIAKLAAVLGIAWAVYGDVSRAMGRKDHVHELYGAWSVESFVSDGVERGDAGTDPGRWRTVIANPRSLAILPMTGEREVLPLQVDAIEHAITVTLDDRVKDNARPQPGHDKLGDRGKEVWSYTRPAPDRLVIEGVHRGRSLHVVLRRDPEPPLVSRGFHWITEVPFSR